MFYQSSHGQLPAELFTRIGQVREGGTHQCGPEDDGEVRRGHLVDVIVLLDNVQVLHEKTQGAEVGPRHGVEDDL